MREFFKGWRRKVGCAALVMSLLLTGGWIRSLGLCEEIYSSYGVRSLAFLASGDGYVACGHARANNADGFPQKSDWPTLSPEGLYNALKAYRWTGPCVGFGLGTLEIDEHTAAELESSLILAAPYWSIVVPLTLLSGYLLLSSPRSQKSVASTQTAEPTQS